MVPTPSGSNRWVVELRKFRQTIAERALVAEKDFGLVKKHLARCFFTNPKSFSATKARSAIVWRNFLSSTTHLFDPDGVGTMITSSKCAPWSAVAAVAKIRSHQAACGRYRPGFQQRGMCDFWRGGTRPVTKSREPSGFRAIFANPLARRTNRHAHARTVGFRAAPGTAAAGRGHQCYRQRTG